jgi:hypothetical protein
MLKTNIQFRQERIQDDCECTQNATGRRVAGCTNICFIKMYSDEKTSPDRILKPSIPISLGDTKPTLAVAQLGKVCKRFYLLSKWSQTVVLDAVDIGGHRAYANGCAARHSL